MCSLPSVKWKVASHFEKKSTPRIRSNCPPLITHARCLISSAPKRRCSCSFPMGLTMSPFASINDGVTPPGRDSRYREAVSLSLLYAS